MPDSENESTGEPNLSDVMAAVKSLTDRFSGLETALKANSDSLDKFKTDISNRIQKTESDIHSIVTESKKLVADTKVIDAKATAARIEVNELQQRDRLYNTRFFNLKLDGIQSDTQRGHLIYTDFIKPVFEKLVAENKMPSMPSFYSTHNTSHFLPARSDDEIPPYHFRFMSKNLCELFSRNAAPHIE